MPFICNYWVQHVSYSRHALTDGGGGRRESVGGGGGEEKREEESRSADGCRLGISIGY